MKVLTGGGGCVQTGPCSCRLAHSPLCRAKLKRWHQWMGQSLRQHKPLHLQKLLHHALVTLPPLSHSHMKEIKKLLTEAQRVRFK